MPYITEQQIREIFSRHPYIEVPNEIEDVFGVEGMDDIIYSILEEVGWKSRFDKE
ncbi:MAG: hypothetical protein GY861_20410 [bacterium]|nr:hypothetical protein [bacterium]